MSSEEMKITVSRFLDFVNGYLSNNVISGDTPVGVFGSFKPADSVVVAVRATWLAPLGAMVVISPLPKPAICSAPSNETPDHEMTVTEFRQLLGDGLLRKVITGDTPIGVFHSVTNGEVNVAWAKDIWVPPEGKAVVVSDVSFQDIMAFYGFDKPESN
jgi:hypothetical protein